MSRTLRLPALIVLPLLLLAGLVVQARDDGPAESAVRLSELTATAAAPGTPSSTWYCAAGSATGVTSGEGAGPAEHRVIVSNASDVASTGAVTIYPEGAEPTVTSITVAAHGRTELSISDVAKAPWAAALVETTGGEITVAHELTGPTGRSISDCASTPSGSWYFPAGTTRAGSEMWLALFNPFPGEATVDVSFDTESGVRTPQAFEGIVVPGASVVVKRIGQSADGEAAEGEAAADAPATVSLMEQVATTVSVRSGRIVAEQIQSFVGREGGLKGLTATIGATTPAAVWSFPMGAPNDVDADETVSVFNPGGADTEVLVQVQLDDPEIHGTVEPFVVTVPAHRYAVVSVSGDNRVPDGVPHWVIVRSTDGAAIVAERSLTGGGSGGVSYAIGLPVGATRWLAPVGTAGGLATSQISIANPSPTDTATVTVRRQSGGATTDVAEATELSVAPGERVTLDLLVAGFPTDSSVEVAADIPVLVGQWMAFSSPTDISTPVGVPVGGTQSETTSVIGPTVATEEQLDTGDIGSSPPVADDSLTVPPTDSTVEGEASSTTTTTSATATSTTTTTAGA